ncbi:short-chain dehydrogenase/reductase SDR [Galbibacter marinus]|uniref:Short-chain dehydrogenase/reductase SDR n=1 Tax=Galbibacter marinus TaxID=555500 RepID=K2Q0Y6_9FLAO|nr:SDR family NAD(P)-dependent oxidoreductase [Galbibacter marinus]EKF54561.1 short-chain dehydrogenase/reductase SDR [Galbibacter marinus]
MIQNNNNGLLQKPLGSGFGASSTANDVINGIDLKGKIAIVTGASTGIGLETLKTLSNAGATVVAGVRNIDKAKNNLQNRPNVEIEQLDLMDANSINNFTQKFLDSKRPLDLLINNAGIMFVPLRRNDRGIESQLATNYLAVFQLTANLWSALKAAGNARVLNISSQGHQFAPFDFEDPNFEKRDYDSLSAYGQSKTAINLFTFELDNRAKDFGAEGVDTIAHHTAIINGRTIAVLGTSLDVVYPKSNKDLFKIIKANHLAISQFETNHPILKSNFPQRNRTMALISEATFIIEATEISGTRYQGWEALRLGRALYILENVVRNTKWAREKIQYGAVVLTNKMLERAIEDMPYSTSKFDYEF